MIHDDVVRACNTLRNVKIDADAAKEAATLFGEGAEMMAQGIVAMMRSILDAVSEYAPYAKQILECQRVMNAATPREKQLMHSGRKRIRKKYYDRVKRRIGGRCNPCD